MAVTSNFIKFALGLSLSIVTLNSCTRSSNTTSNVTMNFQQSKQMNQSSSTEFPVHIAVNVSGPDFSTIYWAWDNTTYSTNATATAQIDHIPQGANRLFQVLYVSQDANSNLYFYYGDLTQSLLNPVVPLSINVAAITSSTVQGRIIGRYVDASGAGPTGLLSSYFDPGSGKPSMIVDQNEIFGGWFSVFSLPSNPFTYKADDGTIVLANYAAAPAYVTGQSSAFITVPASYRIFSGQQNTNYITAQNILAGFFGPGSSSKKTCVASAASTVVPYLFSDLAGTSPLIWNGSQSGCTISQTCLVSGGISASTPPCISPDNVNYMKFHELLLSDKDSFMAFKGPFQKTDLGSGNSQGLSGSLSGTSLALNWQFMPGATNKIDGVEVFYKWDNSNNSSNAPYRLNNGYACSQLVKNYGFTSAGKFSTSQISATVNVGSGTAVQSLVALACPFSNSRSPIYFTSAAQYDESNSVNNMNQVTLIDNSGHATTAAQNVCKPYLLQALSNGSPYQNASGMTVALTTNIQSGNIGASGFSTNPSCSGAVQKQTILLPSGVSSTTVYFIGTTSSYFSVSTSTNQASFQNFSTTIGVVQPATPTPTNILFTINAFQISGYYRLASGQCYPVNAELQGTGSLPTTGGGSATLAASGGLTGFFFSGSTCGGTALNSTDTSGATITIGPSDQSAAFSFKPDVVTATTGGAQLLASGISPASASGIPNIKAAPAIQAAAPNAYALLPVLSNNQNAFDPGACVPISISAANNFGASIQSPSIQTLNLSATGGALFSDYCGGSTVTSITLIPQNNFTQVFLQIQPSSTTASFSVTDVNTQTQMLSLTLAAPSQLNWSGPSVLATGTCVPMSLSAVNSSGQPYLFPAAQTPSLSSNAFLYSDSLCTSSTSSVNFSASTSNSASPLYMKFTTTVAPSAYAGGTIPINFNGTTVAQTFMTPQVSSGTCSGSGATVVFSIAAAGATMVPAQIPNLSTTVTLSGSPSAYACSTPYTGCTASLTNVTFTNNTSAASTNIFIKPSSPGPVTVTFGSQSLPGINWSNPNMSCP